MREKSPSVSSGGVVPCPDKGGRLPVLLRVGDGDATVSRIGANDDVLSFGLTSFLFCRYFHSVALGDRRRMVAVAFWLAAVN